MHFPLKMKVLFVAALLGIFCSTADALPQRPTVEKINFSTGDGIKMAGRYCPPGAHKPTFILLHGMGSNKEEWQPLEEILSKAGFGFLAYDARGHGESTTTNTGKSMTYQSFGRPGPGSPWDKMTDDLSRAVDFLEKRKDIPPASIGLIGASLGANVSLVYAAHTEAIPIVVALSPGMDYAGLEPAAAMPALADRRVCIAASPGDRYAFESSRVLFQQMGQNRRSLFIEGEGGHGVQMFNGTFEDTLLRWLANRT
jgi:pimeloyl-ACP methyl ester carboxylesterase